MDRGWKGLGWAKREVMGFVLRKVGVVLVLGIVLGWGLSLRSCWRLVLLGRETGEAKRTNEDERIVPVPLRGDYRQFHLDR